MTNTQIIAWNEDDEQSVKRAEQRKTILEDKGYVLIKTRQVNINKWHLTYERTV